MEQFKIVRRLSLVTTALICLTSWQGLISPETYAKETELWTAQARGQDLINLYIIPFYLLSGLLINRKEKYFALIWTGINCYFIYTFLIYCFDIQFNRMFLFYVLILGMTVYSCCSWQITGNILRQLSLGSSFSWHASAWLFWHTTSKIIMQTYE